MIALQYAPPGEPWLTRECLDLAEADRVAAKLTAFGCRVELPELCSQCGDVLGPDPVHVSADEHYCGPDCRRECHAQVVAFGVVGPAIGGPVAFDLAATVERYRRLCGIEEEAA